MTELDVALNLSDSTSLSESAQTREPSDAEATTELSEASAPLETEATTEPPETSTLSEPETITEIPETGAAEEASDTEIPTDASETEVSNEPSDDEQPAEDEASQATSEKYLNLEQALADLTSLRILFESNSDVLAEESLEVLDQIADTLLAFPDTVVSIEGHTDFTGNSADNLALSLARAIAVRDYLVGRGVSTLNLKAKGFGEEVPIADNRTAAGRAANRRIEFTF